MLFTGNHLTVAGDATAGRVLISKIVTETKLKDRKFEHRDLETYVKENRPTLVHAALTILRGFIVADRPGIPSRSRFREFGDLIGNALVYLGEMDPCLSEDAVQILDPIKEGQSSVARAWWKEFRDAPVTVRKRSITRSRPPRLGG
jgi:putative DNA primase/helicase